MMGRRNLPPMNALIAAETVARRGGIKGAAEEMGVTPSAVSHQLRVLEDWLGLRLFERTARAVRATPAGLRYFRQVTPLLDAVTEATGRELTGEMRNRTVRVQTTDSFAAHWLVPRMPAFRAEHGDIVLQISTFEFTEGFRPMESDVAILYSATGTGVIGGESSEPILPEKVRPVCAPALLDTVGGVAETLLSQPVIDDFNLGVTWDEWLAAAVSAGEVGEARQTPLAPALRYNHSHLALKAALAGQGLCLAGTPLVADDLASGQLIAPFRTMLDSGGGYVLWARSAPGETVGRSDRSDALERRVEAVVNWVRREAAVASDVQAGL